MTICLLGINHKTADLKIREQFTVAETEYLNHLKSLITHKTIDSILVLSTCNRTEYYLSTNSVTALEDALNDIFQFDYQSDYVYLKKGKQCATHLFSVTSGIDSLVLGETQIQGQVKRAYDEAQKIGLNSELNKLFQMAFKTAKIVRSDTEIGRNPVSVAHCAVKLGNQIFGSLDQQKVLIIGAGETAELLIRYLKNHNANHITIVNRTASNAQNLASHFDARTLLFGSLDSELHQFDLVFSATASPNTIISQQVTQKAIKRRKFKPVVMIDLSVPRDIDDEIKKIDEVFLYSVDDLQKVITANMQKRESTVDEANRIIEAEVDLFEQWLKTSRHHRLIKQFQGKIESIKEQVLSKQLTQNTPAEQVAKFESLAHQISKKISHKQMIGMKKIIETGNEENIRIMAQLLDLDIENDT